MRLFKAKAIFAGRESKGYAIVCEKFGDWGSWALAGEELPKELENYNVKVSEVLAVLNPTTIDWDKKYADLRKNYETEVYLLEEVKE